MKKDGSINFKLLTKMMPPQFKKIGLDMLEDCKDISKSHYLAELQLRS